MPVTGCQDGLLQRLAGLTNPMDLQDIFRLEWELPVTIKRVGIRRRYPLRDHRHHYRLGSRLYYQI